MKMYNKTRETDMLIIYYDAKDKKHYYPKTVRTNKWQPPPPKLATFLWGKEDQGGQDNSVFVIYCIFSFLKKSHVGFS